MQDEKTKSKPSFRILDMVLNPGRTDSAGRAGCGWDPCTGDPDEYCFWWCWNSGAQHDGCCGPNPPDSSGDAACRAGCEGSCESCELGCDVNCEARCDNSCETGCEVSCEPTDKAYCFPARTQVWINGVTMNIDNVQVGQEIEYTKGSGGVTTCLGTVVDIEKHDGIFNDARRVVFENKNEIIVVGNHSFMSCDGNWIPAGQLQSQSKLQTIQGMIAIEAIHDIKEIAGPVYNLKVSGDHTYLVGIDGLIVRDF